MPPTLGPCAFADHLRQVRLAETLAENEARLEELKDRFNELVVTVRQRERELRQVQRELAPLGQGMAVKTRRDRTVRLRNRVREERAAATVLQRCFRGHRLRQALFSWYRDYWVERVDETTVRSFLLTGRRLLAAVAQRRAGHAQQPLRQRHHLRAHLAHARLHVRVALRLQ